MNPWRIPELRPDRLFERVPCGVYVGKPDNPPELFLWRSAALEKARNHLVGFYRWDDFFLNLWQNPQRYIDLFLQHSVAALTECDFSVWTDDPLATQCEAVRRARWLGRLWQDAGLSVVPSLNWGGPESYAFCFVGVPVKCPLVMVECRTAGGTWQDRRAFLAGLTEGVQRVEPRHVVIYGGRQHEWWLKQNLPTGPGYTFLDSWSAARRRRQRRERFRQQHQHQLVLFPTMRRDVWADVEVSGAKVG